MWDYSLGTSSALSSSSLGRRADNAAFILSTAVGKIVIPTRNSQHSEPVNRLKSCGSGNSHRCYLTNTNVCSAGLEKSRLKPWAILPFRKAPVQFSIWHLLAVLFCLLREKNFFLLLHVISFFSFFTGNTWQLPGWFPGGLPGCRLIAGCGRSSLSTSISFHYCGVTRSLAS